MPFYRVTGHRKWSWHGCEIPPYLQVKHLKCLLTRLAPANRWVCHSDLVGYTSMQHYHQFPMFCNIFPHWDHWEGWVAMCQWEIHRSSYPNPVTELDDGNICRESLYFMTVMVKVNHGFRCSDFPQTTNPLRNIRNLGFPQKSPFLSGWLFKSGHGGWAEHCDHHHWSRNVHPVPGALDQGSCG